MGIQKRSLVLLGSTLAVISFFASDAKADLITNGDFESPSIGSTNFVTYTAGDSSITGWTIVSGSVDIGTNNGMFPVIPFSGSQSLDLNGIDKGTIRQTFSTVAGTLYDLQFEYGNNPYGGNGFTATATISLSNGFSGGLSHTGSTQGNMAWTLYNLQFTADASTTTLTFTSTIDGTSGLMLDAVSVNIVAVPEPSSISLLALSGVCFLGRKIRRIRLKKSRSTDTVR